MFLISMPSIAPPSRLLLAYLGWLLFVAALAQNGMHSLPCTAAQLAHWSYV